MSGKEISINDVTRCDFYKRKEVTKWVALRSVIYNKSTNLIFGRTPSNWGKLFLFYAIFYSILAAFFAVCMKSLLASLDERAPIWKLEKSLIGVNPGLGIRPLSHDENKGSLIWYSIQDSASTRKWLGLINSFMEPYHRNQTREPFTDCNFEKPPGIDRVCAIDTKQFGNCNPQNVYGYNTSSPCVFIKLNRIFDWVPKFHTAPVQGMPEDLVVHIIKSPWRERNQVWVSCKGFTQFDRENVKGFKYSPHGFASFYYPYTNVPHYLSPLVAVQVLDITPNIIVSIECRAWAQNIEYEGSNPNKLGSIKFKLRVDNHRIERNFTNTSV